MRRARLFAAISAAALCISMMGNVPMVSVAQEEARIGTNVATGTDADADAGAEVPVIVDEEEVVAQEAVYEEISEEESSELTASITGWDYRDNQDGTVTITKYTGSDTKAVIPSEIDGKTVTRIEEWAFRNHRNSLTGVEIPVGVTSIGANAFSGCSGLTSMQIPESVTSIGAWAFYGCSGLTEIKIPSGVTSIETETFFGCSGLTGIEIPSSVTSIGSWAFYGCSGLTEIKIPAGVTSIENSTFKGCSGLTSIEIPSSVTSIGDAAFSGCSGLTGIEIPSGVTSIGDAAFSGCSGLTGIQIPSGVTSIGNDVFSGCSGLTGIQIPSGLTRIGSSAFEGCGSLTGIEIPSSVTSIGDAAFFGCSGLTSMGIPAGVTSIGHHTFYGCSSLTDIEIPSGVTSIGQSAFEDCGSLTDIEIPSGVTSIKDGTFYGCSGLTGIKIPSGVTSIGDLAFDGCSGLTRIEIPSGVTSIGNGAFQGCSGLAGIEIPAGVTSIGDYAFAGCNSLTIYGVAGSAAETYAKEKNIPFAPLCGESDLSKLTVIADSVTYNGDYQTAELYIVDGNNRYSLREGDNYTGTVKRKAAGTTTVTITGKGYYTGETTVSFTVNPLNLKNAFEAGDVVLTAGDLEYTGRLLYSPVKVTYKGKVLTEGTGYSLKGNGRKAVGTSWAVVTGTGNYTGTIKVKYAMKKASQSKMIVYTKDKRAVDVRTKGATIQLVASSVRDGAKIVYSVEKPNQGITVSSSGKVTVKKGTKPGKYRIKVLAESTPYYKATSKYFTIVVK